jgi:hypothetical protein
MNDELPLTLVTNMTRTLRAAVAVTTSPFTGTQQVQDWGGRWWEYEIEFAATQTRDGRKLSAFFAALGGAAGTFVLRDPYIDNPTGLGTPLVKGGGQSGSTLLTDGWTGTGLYAGDCFSLGTGADFRLYQMTADAPPTAGNATLNFVPPLRSVPADNAALNVTLPGVLLRATSPIPAQIGLGDIYRFSITAREAI